MTIDLKTISADTTFGSGAFLFGADSQSASEPSLYSESTVFGYLLGLANTWTNSQTINTGEKTASAPILDMSQTWNNGAVTFTGIKSNVTDTASASGSLLMDLQVGGSSKFKVTKVGDLTVTGTSAVNASVILQNDAGVTSSLATGRTGFAGYSGKTLISNSGNNPVIINTSGGLDSNGPIAWNVNSGGAAGDTILSRKAAASLRLGAADAASPVAQTLGVQSVAAGQTNVVGQDFKITGSQGTGSGAGGSIIFQVAPAGSSGTAQNALVNALEIDSNRQLICYADHTSGYGIRTNMISPRTQPYLMFQAYQGVRGPGANSDGFAMTQGCTLQWTGTDNINNTADTILRRDAANTLALRNGTNAQAFNIYNTYTDASNYERGFVKWDTNVLKIGTEKLGTGTARALEFQTDGTTRLTISSNGGATFAGLPIFSDGVIRLANSNGDIVLSGSVIYIPDAVRFGLGGATSSFPALKRSTTSLQVRLADDSGFTNIQGKLTTETAYTAGAPTATGYIVLYDSTGTAYKVPAEAL